MQRSGAGFKKRFTTSKNLVAYSDSLLAAQANNAQRSTRRRGCGNNGVVIVKYHALSFINLQALANAQSIGAL
jgi:hypothetical protein